MYSRGILKFFYIQKLAMIRIITSLLIASPILLVAACGPKGDGAKSSPQEFSIRQSDSTYQVFLEDHDKQRPALRLKGNSFSCHAGNTIVIVIKNKTLNEDITVYSHDSQEEKHKIVEESIAGEYRVTAPYSEFLTFAIVLTFPLSDTPKSTTYFDFKIEDYYPPLPDYSAYFDII